MKAKKENKVYEVDKVSKDRYVKDGYDIYDDNGKLVQSAKNKTVSYEEFEKVKAELEEAKKGIKSDKELEKASKKIEGLEKENSELIAKIEELEKASK